MTFAKFEQTDAKAHGQDNSDHTNNLYHQVHQLRVSGHHDATNHSAHTPADSHLPSFQIVDDGMKQAGKAIAGTTAAVEHTLNAGAKQAQQAMHHYTHDICHDNPVAEAAAPIAAAGVGLAAIAVATGAAPIEGGAALVGVTVAAVVGSMATVGTYLHNLGEKGQ